MFFAQVTVIGGNIESIVAELPLLDLWGSPTVVAIEGVSLAN